MSLPTTPAARSSPATPAIAPASASCPNASSTRTGAQVVPVRSSSVSAFLRDDTASRSNICTNNPDSGRVDHCAFAVTWNSTTCPCPIVLRVTSGVPSASEAITRSASFGSGCATTCEVTFTSSGISRPKNGESWLKGCSAFGAPQLIAPPTVRPPARKRTGISASSTLRLMSLAAIRAPAKRTSNPPFSTHSISPAVCPSVSLATSASTITSGLAGSTSSNPPLIRSAVGSSACFR